MIITIAIFAFVFVALSVAGCRAIDTLERASREARKPNVTPYNGPLYSRHGRLLG